MGAEQICRQTRALRESATGRRAALMCDREPEVIDAIASGVNDSLKWCALEFEDSRWNCAAHSRQQRVALQNTLRLGN